MQSFLGPKSSSMVLAIGVFSLLPAVRASASVIPGDTVDVDVVAFNNTTNLVVYVVRPLDITFGTTNTYAGGDVNGQNVTVSSSEVIGGTTTTDTLVISVPTNFDVNSSAYNGLQFDSVRVHHLWHFEYAVHVVPGWRCCRCKHWADWARGCVCRVVQHLQRWYPRVLAVAYLREPGAGCSANAGAWKPGVAGDGADGGGWVGSAKGPAGVGG
jgi:hypothetical protein